MMIQSPIAGARYASAAALDRELRSGTDKPEDAEGATDDTSSEASPDVVVTLSRGASSPSTYDASGRMAGPPTLDDLGANGAHSMAHASESDGDDAGSDSTPANADQDDVAA